jgi:hypothetical protein
MGLNFRQLPTCSICNCEWSQRNRERSYSWKYTFLLYQQMHLLCSSVHVVSAWCSPQLFTAKCVTGWAKVFKTYELALLAPMFSWSELTCFLEGHIKDNIYVTGVKNHNDLTTCFLIAVTDIMGQPRQVQMSRCHLTSLSSVCASCKRDLWTVLLMKCKNYMYIPYTWSEHFCWTQYKIQKEKKVITYITFSNQRFSNCSSTVDVGIAKLTLNSFCGNRFFNMNILFCSHLCCSILWSFGKNSSQCTISFCQCSFLPTVPLHWYLPMIYVCQHNLRNCHSQHN